MKDNGWGIKVLSWVISIAVAAVILYMLAHYYNLEFSVEINDGY